MQPAESPKNRLTTAGGKLGAGPKKTLTLRVKAGYSTVLSLERGPFALSYQSILPDVQYGHSFNLE